MAVSQVWNSRVWGWDLASSLTGTVTWWRSTIWPDGRTLSAVLGTGNPITDATVPLEPDAGTRYTAVDDTGGSEDSALLYGNISSEPILNCPGDTRLPAVAITVLSQRDSTVTSRTMFYDVLDRDRPWVEPIPPIDRTGTMEFWTPDPGGGFPGQKLNLARDLLRSGKPLLLRTVCAGRAETLTFVPTRWTEMHIGQPNHHGPDRRHVVDWRAAEAIWGEDVEVPARLWFSVPIEFDSWAGVAGSGLNWKQLAWGGPP